MTTSETVYRKNGEPARMPQGCYVPPLRAWQQAALTQWHALHGLLIVAGVGSGKSLVGALVARTASRAVVVLPGAVRGQTERMYAGYGVQGVTFISYTELTRASNATRLEDLVPDVLILDEAHTIKRVLTNSAAKRIQRYLVANPAVRVCVLSASMFTDRVTDFAHLALWALRGGVRGLIPQTRSGVEALEERLAADPAARQAFMARLLATPGVVDHTTDATYSGEVQLSVIELEPALTLAEDWSLPDGYLLVSPAQAASVTRMLAWGFWPRVTPRPSEAYLEARRAWSRVVQGVVATGAADTEYQVRELRPEAYAAWAAVDAAEPEGIETPVWETARGLTEVQRLVALRDRSRRMIVWAYHRALQAKVAELLGCPHHGPGGLDADGVRLDETRAPLVVASIEACHEGLNAQHFSHSLVLEPPSDPEVWRQLVGRTARQGQLSPCVSVEVVVNCSVARQALRTAIARAEASGKANPILQLKDKV